MLQPTLFIRWLWFLSAEFLEARIIPQRIKHRIDRVDSPTFPFCDLTL
jgi:hypothetical protein